MSRNGSGVYNLPNTNPVVPGSTISTTWANGTMSDIAAALTGSVAADGQTPITGNLAMGGNKLTGLGAGTVAGNSVEYAQFVAATTTNVAITGGAIDGTTIGVTTPAYGRFSELIAPAGTTAQRPVAPVNGDIRYNTTYNQYEGYSNGVWGQLGGGATGGGNNQVFVLNDQAVTADYTVPTGKNASSAGPITIDTGVTVTVSTDSTWVIV